MKTFIAYTIAYFVIYFPISVGVEAFIWQEEPINASFLLLQAAQALLFALLMSLLVVVYKKANSKKVR